MKILQSRKYSGLFLGSFWALMGATGSPMSGSGSLGMSKIDKGGGVDKGMNLGCCNQILTIQSNARENAAV